MESGFYLINFKLKTMYTAECVSPMHPDKICDRISDSILDECLKQDPYSRVAVETLGGHKKIVVMGEITSSAKLDIKEIIKKELNDPSFEIIINIVTQSPQISQGVDIGGAGDQGIMIGYACNETEELIPLEHKLSRSLCQFIFNQYPYDGKTQVSVNNKRITDIVASFQNVSKDILKQLVLDWLKKENISEEGINFWINEAGDWNLGGFDADTGLTGRKIVIDAYGPRVPVAGGAFSGKDATKVDRSGALMARHIAVETLKKTKAQEVLVQVCYVIGKPEPLELSIKADNKEIPINQELINRFILKNIIEELDLRKPQYKELSMWGHFGHNHTWDK